MYHASKMFPVKVGWHMGCLIPGVSQMLSWEICGLVLRGNCFVALSCCSFIHFLSCLQPPSLNALQLCQLCGWEKLQNHIFAVWLMSCALLAEAMRQYLPKDCAYFSCGALQTCTHCAGWLNWGAATLGTCLHRIAPALGRFLLKTFVSRRNFFLNKKAPNIPHGFLE